MPGRIAYSKCAAKCMLSHEWAARRMGMIERIVKKNQLVQPLAGLPARKGPAKRRARQRQ